MHWNIPRGDVAIAHQRLRQASRTALQVARNGSPSSVSALQPLAESIAQQSIKVERDLVSAARTHGSVRFHALAQPILEVGRIEATLAQLQITSAQWQSAIDGPTIPDLLDDVQDRLAALQHASVDLQKEETPVEQQRLQG
jgi:hypothetical protein